MYQKILVPLDGSALAERALPYARAVAQMKGSEMILFTVSTNVGERADRPMQAYLESKCKEMESYEIKASTVIAFGSAAEEIADFAEKNNVKLVIISTHGYSGIKRWLLGSVASRVLSTIPASVLLVKSRAAEVPAVKFGRILLPLDGSPFSETSIPHVEELVKGTDAEVILLRVVEPVILPTADFPAAIDSSQAYRIMAEDQQLADKYLTQVEASMKQKGIEVRHQLAMGKAADSIIEVAGKESVNLIAMTTHGRTGISRWIFGSVARRVLAESLQPVLLIRPAAQAKRA